MNTLPAPACPVPTLPNVTPLDRPPSCAFRPHDGVFAPDDRAGAFSLKGSRFDLLTQPRRGQWAPRIYAPRADFLLTGAEGMIQPMANVLAEGVAAVRDLLDADYFPTDLHCVLLPEHHFRAALAGLDWHGNTAVFRQVNGVMLINADEAFAVSGASIRVAPEAAKVIEDALNLAPIGVLCRQERWAKMLLPVRHHADESFVTLDTAVESLIDFLFIESVTDAPALTRMPDARAQLIANYRRLFDADVDNSGRAGVPHPALQYFIKRLVTYTTVVYANLLDERLRPVLAKPMRVADSIESLHIHFGRAFEDDPLGGYVTTHPRFGTNIPRELHLIVCDDRGNMIADSSALLHELVHIGANERLIHDVLSVEGARAAPGVSRSPVESACDALVKDWRYLGELMTEWLRDDLVSDGQNPLARPRAELPQLPMQFESGWNFYKAAYLTTQEGVRAEGDAFIAPFLGKPDPYDEAGRYAHLGKVIPALRAYCQAALARAGLS